MRQRAAGAKEGVLGRSPGEVFISDLVALEVLATIRIAFRTAAYPEYKAALDRFRADYSARFSILEADAAVRTSAMGLTAHHRQARARSMDVLHLGAALRLQSGTRSREVTLVTSDRDLADLATQWGLRTFDPSREPLAALPRVPRR